MDDKRHTLIVELPELSDQAAAELLDLFEQFLARLDQHYYAQAARHQHRLRSEKHELRRQRFGNQDEPF